jgi:hypothetical protein
MMQVPKHAKGIKAKDVKRFIAKVEDSPDGCWIWMGASNERYPGFRYGQFNYKGKSATAHRAAYEMFVGPVPPGLVLDHLCRNPRCVNPDHLEPVTHAENMRRGVRWSPEKRAAAHRTHCRRGHELTPENTYVWHGPDGYTRRQCRTCLRESFNRSRRKILAA